MKTWQHPKNEAELAASPSMRCAKATLSMRIVLGWIRPVLHSILIAGSLMTGSALAQTAQLSGVISDPSGARIPKASVTILHKDTGIARDTVSNEDGYYTAPLLQPGNYMVTVKAAGFATQVRTSVTLEVGQQQVLNFSLKVGNITQTVQVSEEAPTVELASSSLDAQVSPTTVRELPLNGRSWLDLATLQPGVAAIQTQPAITNPARGGRGFGAEITVGGARPQQNNYRLDGISLNDYANGPPGSVLGGNLGVDAIQEFSVLTSNYSSEYGRGAGGIVNAVTREGTNQFHGSVYEFLRNSALDARNFFDGSRIPPFRRNQFGAAAGGPIRRDKLFIFGDYEGIRQSKGITNLDTVPSAAARNGTVCSAPDTTPACSPTTISVDPSAQKYLPLWPLPNGGIKPGTNGDIGIFTFAAQQITTDNFGTARADYKISDKDSITATYLGDIAPFTTPDSLDNVLITSKTNHQVGVLEETHLFSTSLVNSARFGLNREAALNTVPVSAINPLAADTSLGVLPGQAAAQVQMSGITSFTGGVNAATHNLEYWNSFQGYDDVFWTRGTHSMKFGVAVERMQLNAYSYSNPGGVFVVGTLSTFLTNHPKRFTSGGLTSGRGQRVTLVGGYAQDDWRVRPNLTVNLGLRYEMSTVPTEVHDRLSALLNITDSTPHLGSPFFSNPTRRNFEPRVGFAWDPFHNGKTAVRGGFGMFDVLPLPYLFDNAQSNTYPFFNNVNANPLPPGTFFQGAAAFLSAGSQKKASAYYVEQNPHRTYVMQWNLNVQRELARNLTVLLGYAGSRGVHEPIRTDDSDMVYPTLTSAGWLYPAPIGSGTRINPNWGKIRDTRFEGDSYYDALELGVQKTMSHGLQLQGSFTWGKNIDTGSSTALGNQFDNSVSSEPLYDLRSIRGLSDYDIGRTLVINGIWQVPSLKSLSGFAARIANGWELGVIFKVNDGVPFTPTFGVTDGDPAGVGSGDPWNYPNRLTGPGCASLVNPGNPTNYIKTECFPLPTAPSMGFWQANCDMTSKIYGPNLTTEPFPVCFNLRGNAGRNILIGPGLENLDFSIFKNNYINRISESFNIQFRAEIFNILNRANFAVPVTSDNTDIFNSAGVPTGVAGLLTSTTTDSRQIQFGVKFIW